jgi:hypothetical protein
MVMNVISLQTLIRTIKSSIVRSTQVLEDHHLRRLSEYFNEDGTPETVELELDGKKCQVPAFTLVNHQSLSIEGLEMEFKARLFDYDVPKDTSCDCEVLVDVKKPKDDNPDEFAHIKISFKQTDSPEALQRINDQLLQQLNL